MHLFDLFEDPQVVNEKIGPGVGQELELMLAGKKPAALVEDSGENDLFAAYDKILIDLCNGIVKHQKQNSDRYGLVAAAVVDPDHNVVYGINHKLASGKRVHAERAAMANYIKRHGVIPKNSIIITTLSPCTDDMPDRKGPSCTELLNGSPITRVYAGYRDPSQTHLSHDEFDVVYTQNSKIESVCKQIADCFLKESAYTDPANYCGEGVAEGATVTRIDSKPITDFGSSLKAYKHTDDWSQSGVDTGDDSYWKNKNLKTNTTKGLFAGDPKRTALYATGNAHETRYVEFTQDGQPIVYFDRKDLPAMRSRKTYLTVFDANDFRQLPTGEWFSENPGKPIKQVPIGDPFKYIASQGWIVRVTDDLDKVFKQVKNMHKAGKIVQYGAEGMNESKQGVAEGVPQPGPSSGAPKQFGADAKIQTRQMTVKDIISSIPGVPYYNNVVDDWDAKDYSWGVTKKVIEYATYLKDHPESLAKLPPAIVLNGKFEDGAHRVSAIWLLQQRMDPKNPLWKNAKLNVQFVKQGVAENFADGRNPGRKGLSKRMGVNTKASVSSLRKTAKHSTGEKARMAHWLANMKAGKKKHAKEAVDEDAINEIENLQSYQYTGGKDVLKHPRYTDPDAVSRKNIKPLPGSSGLNYATIDHGRFLEIRMLDQSGQEAVGQLKLMRVGFPINNAYQVSTVTVDEDYRGKGIAKSLYGVALSILKITLLAGSQQTPGGKRNWMSLAQIPGVEVRGYVELENSDLKYKKLHKQKNAKDLANAERRNAIVDKNIDIVMGRLGGDYLGDDEDGNMIFAFDVVPGTGSLTPAVKTELNKLYYGEYDMLYVTGLYAQWRGA